MYSLSKGKNNILQHYYREHYNIFPMEDKCARFMADNIIATLLLLSAQIVKAFDNARILAPSSARQVLRIRPRV